MSVTITVDHAVKKYGDVTVIPDLSMQVNNGEFFTLLGPSGCGKTTLLRMIAGFNSIEGGSFYFNDIKINDMDPGKRGIGMVFQNYAIFPNMTVRKNVEFGLKYKKISKEEMRKRSDRFLKLVHVDQYADRMPQNLSGGQQQRVALARALVISPDVLLMDEPLSNLDAKLRVEMRGAIRHIQKEVGTTTIYVTHDQEEAMAISDRIAVMDQGVIRHCGKPSDIYSRPKDLFVATFIGKSNILEGRLVKKDNQAVLEVFDEEIILDTIRDGEIFDRTVKVSIRPEEWVLKRSDGIPAVVKDRIFLGATTQFILDIGLVEWIEMTYESEPGVEYKIGQKVYLGVKKEKINVFDMDSEQSIMKGVVHSVYESD